MLMQQYGISTNLAVKIFNYYGNDTDLILKNNPYKLVEDIDGIGFYTGDKIASLQADKAALTAQLSQNAQTRTLIDTLRPVAQPAYITCSPYESVYGCFKQSGCGCPVVQ